MTLDEAIKVLRRKLAHITRDYRPEDEAFDVLCKAARSDHSDELTTAYECGYRARDDEVAGLRARIKELEAEPRISLDKKDKKYPWTGEGPEPAKWFAADGTLVYRSYADYVDD